MTLLLKRLQDFLSSEEGQKDIAEFCEKLTKDEEVLNNQLERLSKRPNFVEIVEKVIVKYNDSKYVNRWYKRGIEPPESLFWILFNYAEKYGRECTKEEWKQYGNMFSSALYFCNGYFFNRMDGQGSIIQVIKQ